MAAVLPLGVKAKRILLDTFYSVGVCLLKTEKEKQIPPMYWMLMFANAYGTYAAYTGGDYVSAIVCLLTFVGIPLWFLCLPRPSAMTENQRIWTLFTLWFLTTAILFGYAYEYQQFVPWPITVVQYTFALFFGAYFAYVYIAAIVKSRNGEHGTGDVENQRIDAGDLKSADSNLEKV